MFRESRDAHSVNSMAEAEAAAAVQITRWMTLSRKFDPSNDFHSVCWCGAYSRYVCCGSMDTQWVDEAVRSSSFPDNSQSKLIFRFHMSMNSATTPLVCILAYCAWLQQHAIVVLLVE